MEETIQQYQINNLASKPFIRLLLNTVMTAVLLAGCSLAPPHERPAMPVPNMWPSAKDSTAVPAPRLDWQQFFCDPELKANIETALLNNRDLRVAIARVEKARSLYQIQRADLFPQLFGQDTAFRFKVPGNALPTGKNIIGDLNYGFLKAGWEIDLWGRVRNLSAAAFNTWLSMEETRRTVTLILITEVANTWLFARELDERILLAKRTIETRRESDRIARRRYELGYSPRIDLTQADALLGQAKSALISLEQQREQTRNALALLLGAPACNEIKTLASAEGAVMRNLPPGIPSELLVQRPDIRGAEFRLIASEANIGAARADFFPRIALFADYGALSTTDSSELPSATRSAWVFGANALQPIFNGGRLLGGLSSAKADRAIAISDYEKTVQSAFRDVADALAARRWLKLQVTTQQKTTASLAERAHLANLRYVTGSAPYLEVLEAQRDLFDSEQSLVETRRALLSSEVNLYAAIGGGCDDPSAPTAALIHNKEGRFP